jgi:tetratricopeptide (TPR) repeat protein
MSVAWFTKLFRLNDAGKFDEVIKASKRFIAARPKDYALHLQRAKALLSVGRLEEAGTHLEAALTFTDGQAAWPWFYRAALHARLGARGAMLDSLGTAVRLDPRLAEEARKSPFFAAYWASRPFLRVLSPALVHARGAPTSTRASAGGAAAASERAPRASGRPTARATSPRPRAPDLRRTARSARGTRRGTARTSRLRRP